MRLKCDGTRAETRFRLSTKRTSPFKSAGASLQSTTGSRGVRISVNNAGYAKFRGSVKRCEGDWLPTPFARFPFTSPACVTVWHHVSNAVYVTSSPESATGPFSQISKRYLIACRDNWRQQGTSYLATELMLQLPF